MKKPWSISTTVRNPERLRDFLKVLKNLEGKKFDKNNQIKYQIMLIKEGLYIPTKIPKKYLDIFKEKNKEVSYNIAKEIFEYQDYEDPSMRGRQSANPLNKLGFCVARENYDVIKITRLGNLFLSDDYNISKVFFKSLLKLQFPNPWSKKFNEKSGFNISPFIAVLHFLKKIKSLSRDEFCIFVPTLINYKDIGNYCEKVRQFRQSKNKNQFIETFLKEFYEVESLSAKQKNNLFDYGDNIIRYFRLTKYFKVSKETLRKWKVELETSRGSEISQLLEKYDGSIIKYETTEQYLDYLSDFSLPKLPWEFDINKAKEIVKNLKSILKEEYSAIKKDLKIEFKSEFEKLYKINTQNLNLPQIEKLIGNIRDLRLNIRQMSEGKMLRKNSKELKKIILQFKEKKFLREIDPTEFEFLIFKTLKILNDELNLRPNCIFDDEGKPISFAPGNKADIEGLYTSFNAIFEATLDVSRNQVYRESMPVMRHLKDFENKHPEKNSYCVFIAPRIHEDTNNYFWFSIKQGYEGSKQKIISLDIRNYLTILEFFVKMAKKGKIITHDELLLLFEKILFDANKKESSSKWLNNVSNIINEWKNEISC